MNLLGKVLNVLMTTPIKFAHTVILPEYMSYQHKYLYKVNTTEANI